MKSQRGFSLIELMVSVVIGLLAIVFTTRAMVAFEDVKRSSTGGSDSMQNGMVAMFTIESEIAKSGWGLNDSLLLGCRVNFADSQGYTLPADAGGVTRIAPVLITNGANSDTIAVNYGSSDTGSGALVLSGLAGGGIYAGDGSVLALGSNPYTFVRGDAIAIAAPTTANVPCLIRQISAVDPTVSPPTLTHAADGTTMTRLNGNASLSAGSIYPSSQSRIFNLGKGDDLSFHTWSVANGRLMLQAFNLTGASAAPVKAVDNIVAVKARYGFDTRTNTAIEASGSSQVGQWSDVMIDADGSGTTGDAGDYQHMVAIRLAVVARSAEPDKPDGSGNCSATTNQPQVFAPLKAGDAAALTLDVSVANDPFDWKCYRYRVFETIVFMRNLGWRPA